MSKPIVVGCEKEYCYDALGRRVMVRTRTDGGLCNYDAWGCRPAVTTFVWAGDQLLWELKSASGAAGGQVSYFHAGGIDRPLVITKGATSIIPHQNWRGQFARGTYPNGSRSDCPPGVTTGCTPIRWPGEHTTARHDSESGGTIQNWFGGLVDGMRDASGQLYMRNRYYDPRTGQFTQTDPIGLAGGLNAYGFANGDPVTYSDPYGLCPGIPRTTQRDLSDCPPGYFSAMGAITGGTIGGIGGGMSGGAAGLTVCSATGPGALVCGGVGATAGAAMGARRGATIGGAVGGLIDGMLLAKRQADAIATADAQVPEINRHLELLNGDPDGNASPHWRTELRGFIAKVQDQIRHMGHRTGAEWQRKVDQWRRDLDRFTPD